MNLTISIRPIFLDDPAQEMVLGLFTDDGTGDVLDRVRIVPYDDVLEAICGRD